MPPILETDSHHVGGAGSIHFFNRLAIALDERGALIGVAVQWADGQGWSLDVAGSAPSRRR